MAGKNRVNAILRIEYGIGLRSETILQLKAEVASENPKLLPDLYRLGGVPNKLNDIYADKKEDIIWVGTEHMGLNAYNYATHQFSYFRHNVKDPTSLASDGVMALSGESSGNIWVSTYEAGVDLLDKKNMQFIHYNQSTVKGLGSNYTRCAIDDNHGNLYVGHLQGGMSIISIKKKTAINFTLNPTDYQSIPSQQIFAIYIDSRKRVWVGTDNGLALFNKDTKKFNVFRRNNNPGSLRSNFITSINEINNEIWIGTTGGLEILAEQYGITEDPARVVFRHLPASENQEGLSYPIVNSILQDSYKNVWITTYGGGINFLSNKAHYFNVITHRLF
jgi:ligand-binding sensor domain-containing protein